MGTTCNGGKESGLGGMCNESRTVVLAGKSWSDEGVVVVQGGRLGGRWRGDEGDGEGGRERWSYGWSLGRVGWVECGMLEVKLR